MDLLCKENTKTMDALKAIMSEFEQNMGLVVNYDKTVMYRIGQRNSAEKYVQTSMAIVTEGVNVLGVEVSEDKDTMLENNYAPLLTKCEAILNLWSKRGLSIMGKVVVVN